jgi:hypothetical protein
LALLFLALTFVVGGGGSAGPPGLKSTSVSVPRDAKALRPQQATVVVESRHQTFGTSKFTAREGLTELDRQPSFVIHVTAISQPEERWPRPGHARDPPGSAPA